MPHTPSMKCIRFDVCKAGSNLWYHWRFSRQNCERWRTATSSNMAISILRSTEPLYSHCECLVAHSGAIQISQKTIGAIAVFVDVSSSSSRWFRMRKGRKNTAEPTQQTLKQYTYLTHYNETRIKKSLDWISPMQHRKHLGLSAWPSKKTSAPPYLSTTI